MVMKPAPASAPRVKFRLPRFNLRCRFGRHHEFTQSAKVAGSEWTVQLHYCKRCWRLLDECHAKYVKH